MDSVNQSDASSRADERVSHEKAFPLALPALTWQTAVWVVIAVAALATRLINLGARVMSHDESMHVYFSWNLAKGGGYVHNPMMHGPLLYELTALFDKIFGATDFTSRIVPALIGVFIVVGVPLLFRRWLGQAGALAASLLLLVSPYVLFYSRYNRHDIYEIASVLVAAFAILSYQRASAAVTQPAAVTRPAAITLPEAENQPASSGAISGAVSEGARARSDRWLWILAGAVALMFTAMETAFFYLAIFASFLFLRMLIENGFNWGRIRRSAQFDLLVVLATLGTFFSSPIALVVLNPIWTKITGQPFVAVTVFNTFGVEWAAGPLGMRIWGLMAFFWLAALVIGFWWGRWRWLELAALFLVITSTLFTTFFTNKSGIGTGFVGSLGYWLSQQGVARGSQPWYFYFIVFPLYEYLPIIGGIAALIYYATRRKALVGPSRELVPFLAWWALLIFVGLTGAGEKMPWLSTHITIPFILLTGWFIGQLLMPRFAAVDETSEPGEETRYPALTRRALAVLPFVILFGLTIHTSYYVNYVDYDYTTEFIDYAHGSPGVTWLMDDVNQVSAKLGQKNIAVPYDNANSWPLAWYLRDRAGFYGDAPDKATLLNSPIVVAGAQTWDKVDQMLGSNYHRYEVARIWWPMEDYKDLSWDRIRGALADPQMRQALWNIFWSRDYTLYAQLTNQAAKFNLPRTWILEDRMRIYIRKDVADQIPNLALKPVQIADLAPAVDVYASKKIQAAPVQVIQPGTLAGPRNLALALDGTVYIADSGNARIVHMDAQGKIINAWGIRTPEQQTPPEPSSFNEPWGLAVDPQGNVYVADTWNHRIQKFDSSGKFLLQFGTAGVLTDGPDRFWGPRAVAIAPNGDIYVTDTGNKRVAVFDPQGKFLFDFGASGDQKLNEPVGLAIDPSGLVYVVDTWNYRVAVFDLSGNFQRSFPVQAWNSTDIYDKPFIALDSSHRVYLTDPQASRVMVFSDQGAPLAVFGEFGQANGNFNYPTGIAFNSKDGTLWIADAGNNRVDVYPTLKP